MAVGPDKKQSVQFLGIKNTIRAYKNVGIPNWALVCGDNLLEAYEDGDMEVGTRFLSKFLDELSLSQSNAYYQLRLYDDLPAKGKIRLRTEAARSFRFTLQEERGVAMDSSHELRERLERLEAKQALETSEDAQDIKDNSIGAMISGLMEEPSIKQALGQGIALLIDKFLKPLTGMDYRPQYTQAPAAIGSADINQEGQVAKVQSAIETLWQVDQLLGDHLTAIAKIAEKDPAKYHKLIGMLNIF